MFLDFVNAYGAEIIGAVLVALFGVIGMTVKRAAVRLLDTKEKREIARVAVRFVEQAFQALHGPDKLGEALGAAERELAKRGIRFDREEMTLMIEAAVNEMNAQANPPIALEVTETHEEEGGA